MNCPACSAPLPDGSAFCTTCGHRMIPSGGGPTVPGGPGNTGGAAGAPGEVNRPSTNYAATGAIVDGKYTIERVLGEGGMGVVYLARELHTNIQVVLKAVRGEIAHRADMRERTLAEGRALARIDHPNVVQLKAVVVEGGRMWLVMQFVEGESLEDLIQRHIQQRLPMQLPEVLGVFRQILAGVAAAHNEGVIHRDLKPANILIRRKDNCVKVTDFGIAKGEDDAQKGKGQTQGIIGSLFYMSSEQVRGQRDLDRRVDIYALGIVLFEMLTGQVPFNSDNTFELLRMHVEGVMPSVLQVRPDLPPQIDQIIQKACAKDREHRYHSCEEFQAAVDAFQASIGLGPAQGAPLTSALPQMGAPMPMGAPMGAPMPMGGGRTQIPSQPLVPGMMGHAPGTITGQPAVYTAQAPRPKSNVGLFVGIGGIAAAGATVGILFATGVLGGGDGNATATDSTPSAHTTTTKQSTTQSPPTTGGGVTTTSSPATSSGGPAKSPLEALVGIWRDEGSGRVLEGFVRSAGDAVELRVTDASQFREEDYQANEVRFVLKPAPDGPTVFYVEDRRRPRPPNKMSYDSSSARATCLAIYADARGAPFVAHLDGDRLELQVAKIAPGPANFQVVGTEVIGCKDLERLDVVAAPATLVRGR
ncbi:MAG: protein kinase [Myxococcales bacterium]|nr:protein kinase [Myxococcales bacterium]